MFIYFTLLLLVTQAFCLADKKATTNKKNETKEEEREFLFNRMGGGLLGTSFSPLLGGASLGPLGLGASQGFPHQLFGGLGGSQGLGGANPFLGGVGISTPGLQNGLLGGLGGNPGLNNPLLGGLGGAGFGNPLLGGGLGSLQNGNNFSGGNRNHQLLLNQLRTPNNINGLDSSFLNPNILHQNAFNQPQDIFARQQQQQMNHLNRLGLLQFPPVAHDTKSNRQSSNDDLMEIMILQYLLGNDNVKDVLGPTRHSAKDAPFERFAPSSRNNFPRRGPLPISSPARRLDVVEEMPNLRSRISSQPEPYEDSLAIDPGFHNSRSTLREGRRAFQVRI